MVSLQNAGLQEGKATPRAGTAQHRGQPDSGSGQPLDAFLMGGLQQSISASSGRMQEWKCAEGPRQRRDNFASTSSLLPQHPPEARSKRTRRQRSVKFRLGQSRDWQYIPKSLNVLQEHE